MSRASRAASLQVVLDNLFGPGDRHVGVLARGAAGPSLAKEIPALVQLDLYLLELRAFIVGRCPAHVRLLDLTLALDQLLNSLKNCPVVQWRPFPWVEFRRARSL